MGDTTVRRRVSEAPPHEESLGTAQLRFEAAALSHAKARAADNHAPTPATRKARGNTELALELATTNLKRLVSRGEGCSAE
jgi:hypothetical protein